MELTELEHGGGIGRLTCVSIADYLCGCVRVTDEGAHWVRPCRFTDEQERALGSCRAWHPGLYRQMAQTSAGIACAFETDASEVVFELWVDDEPTGTSAVLRDVEAWSAAHGLSADDADRLALEVDGRCRAVALPRKHERLVCLALDDPQKRPLPGVTQLPGIAGRHDVRLWLPALRGCAVRRAWCNGTFMTPSPRRPCLLVLGDSIAQGFVTGDPSCTWPARLARHLGMELLNQGLGGQVFQPGMLGGLRDRVTPEAIVVALGTNYRHERCGQGQVEADVRAYLRELAQLWPEVPTWVMTPTWHNEGSFPSHDKSCWRQVPAMLASNVAAHDTMRLVDGARMLDADPSLLADGIEHPNADGARQISDRLYVSMRSATPGGLGADVRAHALDVLANAPKTAFVLAEALRRGRARARFAAEGCVLAQVHNGEQLLWAPNKELAAAVVAALADDEVLDLHTPELAGELARRCALSHVEPYLLGIYDKTRPLPVDSSRTIRVLDESYLPVVMSRYAHADWMGEDVLGSLLADGRFLGGFEGDELVGFIGEHMVGAMGLLEVFPGHRRRGWATALEARQVNRTLARGDVPWTQVFPYNRASLRLQKSLGLTIVSATNQCFLSKG